LILISIAWFFLSLPLISIGVATLGAYTAIISLRETGTVDTGVVYQAVRVHFVPALILGWLPIFLILLMILNVDAFLRGGGTGAFLVSLSVLYFLFYTTLALIMIYLELIHGSDLWTAFKRGHSWVSQNPVLAVMTAGITLIVLGFAAALTVAFVLLFPAIVFSFHVHLHANTRDTSDGLTVSS
jgi:hypothetical protein